MASRGRREFTVQRERERSRGSGAREGDGERTGGKGIGEKRRARGTVLRQCGGEEFRVRDGKAFGCGEGCNVERRNLATSVGALQLESANGRGEKTRGRVQEKRFDNARRYGGGEEKTPLDKLRRCEERVCEGIQRWKEGRGNYKEVEPLVGVAWAQYVRVLQEGGLEQAVREGLGFKVWRNVHYPVIELQRKSATEERKEEGESVLSRALEVFTEQYKSLLESLQSRHKFSLEQIFDCGLDSLESRRHLKLVLLVLIPCHWCLVSLGDLCRYQQQLATPPNWSKPRSYYLKAIQLAPKSGRPYNQLAVIAIKAHRRLDAVYFYMRSLFAKSPVQSAHDNLVGLFEESSRKAERQEKERERERLKLEREAERRRKREEKRERKKRKEGGKDRHVIVFPSGDKEVWVVPGSEEWRERRGRGKGGEVGEEKGEEGEEKNEVVSQESYSDPEEELVKQLTSAFLLVHGKLYTRIGIDQLEEAEERLVQVWRRVLGRRSLGHGAAHRLVKMTVINISSVHHSLNSSDSKAGQSYYLNLAFRVAVLMSQHLVDRVHTTVAASLSSREGRETVDSDLRRPWEEELVMEVLPAVRVWLEWVDRQEGIWTPLLSSTNKTHLRALLLQLSQTLSLLPTTELVVVGPEWAGLWEDGMLMGFMPLKAEVSTETSLATPSLFKLTSEQIKEQNALRFTLLSRTCDRLTSHAHCNEVDRAPNGERNGGEEVIGEGEEGEDESGDDVMVEGYSEEEEGGEEGEEGEGEEGERRTNESGVRVEPLDDAKDANIQRLKAEKERLSHEIEQRSQVLTTTQTVLQEAVAVGERETVVCARFLVPDTNGFVDQLGSIRALVECGHFVLAVPLIVVTELEGLSKGTMEEKPKEGDKSRGKKVMDGAKEAVSYIREAMGPSLQVLTTRGSLLQSLSFTAELTNKASNDDLILESTLSLHHRKLSPSSSAPHIVVLLTDDRNLRVKAHAARLPVKDIPQFMNICRLA